MRKGKLFLVEDVVVDAYKSGTSLQEIGEFHGVHKTTIRRLLISKGVTLRARGKRSKKNGTVNPTL